MDEKVFKAKTVVLGALSFCLFYVFLMHFA